MLSILVANPKGGSGKSTIATHLAASFATRGQQVLLGDTDRQGTASHWLSHRPAIAAAVQPWEIDLDHDVRLPKCTDVLVIDSPANLHGKKLKELVKRVDRIIVPVQPSPFDMWASRDFFAALAEEKVVRKQQTFIGAIGMRVDPRTRAFGELAQFLAGFDLPVLTHLRDTQGYVRAAAAGLTLFDLPPARVQKDLEQWAAVLAWLARQG